MGLKILIVEDDPAAAKLFADYVLSELDAEVEIVEHIGDAICRTADVVLLDLRLPPKFDESETLAHVPKFNPPVIIISAVPDPNLKERAHAAGAVAFFQKLDAIEHPERVRDAILKVANQR